MSAGPAILFSVLLIVLVPFYLFFDRQYAHQVQVKVERANLLAFDSIDAVTVSRGPESVRFKKTPDGKLYQVISPAGAFVPQDLMSAMTALLIKSREVDVVADSTDDLVQYGLDRPRGELLLEAPGKPGPVKVVFGVENPTRTAVYAKVEGSPKIC